MNALQSTGLGLNPPLHVGNLALHCLAVWLAFIFLVVECKRPGVSLGGRFFCASSSTNRNGFVISCRSDLLRPSACSVLLAYERRANRRRFDGFEYPVFGAALLSKEIAIGLPVILGLSEPTMMGVSTA